jgi:hypothetical protein
MFVLFFGQNKCLGVIGVYATNSYSNISSLRSSCANSEVGSLPASGGRTGGPPLVRRVLVLSFVILFLLLSGALVNVYAAISGSGGAAYTAGQVEVRGGDTLWSIASAHKPDSMDIREYVYYLKKLNKLDSSVIREGQILVLPRQ